MKTLTTFSLTGLFLLFFFIGTAQTTAISKPSLFSNFPDEITCTAAQLNSFFGVAQGQNVKVFFNNNILLAGSIKV